MMPYRTTHGKVNVKLLIILIVVTAGLGVSLVAARHIRRRILSERDLAAGTAAFEKQDWPTAVEHLVGYLARNPEDVDVWKKCAEAKLSLRPIEGSAIGWAIGAYRRVLQIAPADEEVYSELAMLYRGIRDFEELAYIAEKRLEQNPDDAKAKLWYADALIGLNRMDEAGNWLEDFVADVDKAIAKSASTGAPGQYPDEYMRACMSLSDIAGDRDVADSISTALSWLDRAVSYFPEHPEARVHRARFYRTTEGSRERFRVVAISLARKLVRNEIDVTTFAEQLLALVPQEETGNETVDQQKVRRQLQEFADKVGSMDIASPPGWKRFLRYANEITVRAIPPERLRDELLQSARVDLLAADDLGTDDPRLRFVLAGEWLNHGDPDRAEAELAAADRLPREVIEERFLDYNDWVANRFLMTSELSRWRGRLAEMVDRVDAILQTLEERRHRLQVLPTAIQVYVIAGRAEAARRGYDEYEESLYLLQQTVEAEGSLAYLRALVAAAEEDSYGVINALQPIVAVDASRPDLWRLLARAFSRTDQTRRAVSALISYLRIDPRDPEMTLQLAKEYLKLRDWNRAFETARLGQTLDPTDIVLRLLRIEASIYLAVEQERRLDKAKLKVLSDELAELRGKNPDRVDIRILQAIIAVYLEEPEKAEQELKLAIEECEEPLRAEMQLIRHYYRTKRLPEAISECRRACERHPETAEPWLALAGLYVANNEPSLALECLREAKDTVSGRWEARAVLMRRAVLEHMYGDKETAIELLEHQAKTDKREIRARALLLSFMETRQGRSGYDRTSDPNGVEEKIVRLIAELKDAEGENGLQWRLHQAGIWLSSAEWRSKQQSIASLLEYCISADPQWSAPPLLMAQMYEKLDDPEALEAVCRQALARNPSATDVADRLMTLLEEQGRLADAEKVRQEVEADSRVKSAWSVRGALQAGEFSRAIEELQLRVANDDRDAKSRVFLARLLYWQDKGNVDQALAYLDQAEEITSRTLVTTGVRASILRAENRQAEAQKILDDFVASQDEFDAFMMRAAYLTREGKLEEAQVDYERMAADEDPDRAISGYVLLGHFYARTERLGSAVEALEEGLKKLKDGVIRPARDPEGLTLKRNLMRVYLLRNRSGDQAKAKQLLNELQTLMPDDPELMKLQALYLLNPTRPEEATAEARNRAQEKLLRVVKIEPTDVEAHLALIDMAMQSEDYETARDRAIRAAGSNPNHSGLLAARARAEMALGNVRLGTQLARMLLTDDPNNVDAVELLVDAGIRSDDVALFDEAIELTRAKSAGDPNMTAAGTQIVARALLSRNSTFLARGLELLEMERRRNPSNEPLLILQTEVLIAMGRAQEAIQQLEAYCATPEGAESVEAQVTLVDLYRITGDMERAEEKLRIAEQLGPDNMTVVHARCLWLIAQQRTDELAGISAAYLSAKGTTPGTLAAAASVLAAVDSTAVKREGLKLFEQALSLSPGSLGIRLGLATTAYQTGDHEQAKRLYRDMLEQYPFNARILNDLAWILQESEGDYSTSLELANRGLKRFPEDPHLLDTRGTILAKIPGRLPEAKEDFAKLTSLAEENTRSKAKALLQLGRVCSQLNESDQARQHLEAALRIDGQASVLTPGERDEIGSLMQPGK